MSPAAVTFGNVPVGSTSNQSLTITNSGGSPVTISQASATGTGFSVAGASLPLTLSPGNSFTLTAIFAPTTTGNASGSISIASAQLSSPVAIQTTGVGMAVSPKGTRAERNIKLLDLALERRLLVAGMDKKISFPNSGTVDTETMPFPESGTNGNE